MNWMDRWLGSISLYQYLRPFVVGVVHGLAGSAAVALLVLTTIRNYHWAIAYLLIFGVGTIAGMMLITMSLASAFSRVGRGRQKFANRLAFASGLLSLGFGLFVIGFCQFRIHAAQFEQERGDQRHNAKPPDGEDFLAFGVIRYVRRKQIDA